MTNFIINGLIFVFIPIGLYFLLGWLVFYHLKTYGIKGDHSKRTASMFASVVIFISLAIILIFLSIDWDVGSTEDFFSRSGVTLNKKNYE